LEVKTVCRMVPTIKTGLKKNDVINISSREVRKHQALGGSTRFAYLELVNCICQRKGCERRKGHKAVTSARNKLSI